MEPNRVRVRERILLLYLNPFLGNKFRFFRYNQNPLFKLPFLRWNQCLTAIEQFRYRVLDSSPFST